jgi:AcrR family transcriptional regulator
MSKNGYRFIDKDPVIDIVRTEHQLSKMTVKKLSETSGISVTTFYSWFGGKTRRPQHLTVKYALEALGVKEVYMRIATGEVIKGPRK